MKHTGKNKNTHGNSGPCENVKIKSGEHIRLAGDGANLGQEMAKELVSVMRSGLRVRVSTEISNSILINIHI